MSSMRISRAFQARRSNRHSSPVPFPVDVVNLIVELTEKGTIFRRLMQKEGRGHTMSETTEIKAPICNLFLLIFPTSPMSERL